MSEKVSGWIFLRGEEKGQEKKRCQGMEVTPTSVWTSTPSPLRGSFDMTRRGQDTL